MLIPARALLAALGLATAVAACSDANPHDYASLEACMVDHPAVELLPELQALTICLVSHYDLGWPTAAACEAYVAAHGDYPSSRAEACAEYIRQQSL